MGRTNWLSSRTIITYSLAIIVAAVCGCAARKLSRELMPTPVAVSYTHLTLPTKA